LLILLELFVFSCIFRYCIGGYCYESFGCNL